MPVGTIEPFLEKWSSSLILACSSKRGNLLSIGDPLVSTKTMAIIIRNIAIPLKAIQKFNTLSIVLTEFNEIQNLN